MAKKVFYRFGLCAVAFKNARTGKFLGAVEDVQSAIYTEDLEKVAADAGGCLRLTPDVQLGGMTAECVVNFNTQPNWLLEMLNGVAPTEESAESSGNVGTLTNTLGTSLVNATTGIATATAKSGSEASLKYNRLYVIAASATTVDVYADNKKEPIVEGLTITASTAAEIVGTGVELTGGSGTIGMTTGDEAVVEVRPINTGRSHADVIGTETIDAVEITIYGQELLQKKQARLTLYKAIGGGMGDSNEAKTHNKREVPFTVYAPDDGTKYKNFEIVEK